MGAVEAIKDNVRDARAGAVLGHVVRDVRYAARALMKSRGFAVIIVTTLALGSAGVTTMFALVNAILIQPLALSRVGPGWWRSNMPRQASD